MVRSVVQYVEFSRPGDDIQETFSTLPCGRSDMPHDSGSRIRRRKRDQGSLQISMALPSGSRISKNSVPPPSWIGPGAAPLSWRYSWALLSLVQKRSGCSFGREYPACRTSAWSQSAMVGSASPGRLSAMSEGRRSSQSAGTFACLQSKVLIHHCLAASTFE